MAYKQDWFKDATDSYESSPGKDTTVTFKFPNAATGPLEFTTWLYKHDEHGHTVATNQAAAMLQCYVEAAYEGHIVAKEQS